MKSWASSKRSRLNGGCALCETLSRPVPCTQPVTSRPREITSISASDSASQSGSSQIGRMFPSSRILGVVVIRARIAASTFITPPMQAGVLWCSLSISASKPTSSA